MLKAELKAWKVLHGAAVVVIVAIVLVMRLFWGDAFNNENVKQAICKDIAREYGVDTEYINLTHTAASKPIFRFKV